MIVSVLSGEVYLMLSGHRLIFQQSSLTSLLNIRLFQISQTTKDKNFELFWRSMKSCSNRPTSSGLGVCSSRYSDMNIFSLTFYIQQNVYYEIFISIQSHFLTSRMKTSSVPLTLF